MEETLWRVLRGSPSPEELAAVAAVLTALAARREEAEQRARRRAGWRSAFGVQAAGSWRQVSVVDATS